ncbi:MAG: MotA/TolQ/ExbB proton channel family protein [Cyanobacterium sp. T60_A2020_053]|nr:MotA/TolQ/ExbB proton channel family protein [Cyanobacterium sp. T60_A2020_053]
MPLYNQSNRQELDINLPYVSALALVFTLVIYLLLLPVRNSYLGVLFIDRGITQYVVVFLACFVIATTLNKYSKIEAEFKSLKQIQIPENISFDNYKSAQLKHLSEYFTQSPTLVKNRLGRVLLAYINSGSRKASSELALDDSSFYLTASESSYSFPRILVWAIPLLGFVGTVLGISSAVNGFSGFLEGSSEVEQIKEGIGTVTSGLAVAFDTTLLALLLSIIVMIPLVLIERRESQLLLRVDLFINDQLLPKFSEKETNNLLNTESLKSTIDEAIKTSLPSKDELIKPIEEAMPSPEDLIKPAEIYAKEVAQNLLKGYFEQFNTIQQQESVLIESIREINQGILTDREKFIQSYVEQQKFYNSLVNDMRDILALVNQQSQVSNDNFLTASEGVKNELSQVAILLENRLNSLEKSAEKFAQLSQFQDSLDRLIVSLKGAGEMEQTLINIKEEIALLAPVMKDLSKPRVIRLVEQIES